MCVTVYVWEKSSLLFVERGDNIPRLMPDAASTGPSPYAGDPFALEGACSRLRRGLGIRVLAVAASAGWQAHFSSQLNHSFPRQPHSLVSLKVPSLNATRCLRFGRELLAETDLLVLEPGAESSAHFADEIRVVEHLLHSALPSNPRGGLNDEHHARRGGAAIPSAMLLLHGRFSGPLGGVKSADRREAVMLRSPSHALLLLSQFYGMPVAWLKSRHDASRELEHEDDGPVALLRKLTMASAAPSVSSDGERVASGNAKVVNDGEWWPLPTRRMILPGATMTDPSACPSSTRAAPRCLRWQPQSNQPVACEQRLRMVPSERPRLDGHRENHDEAAFVKPVTGPCQQPGAGSSCAGFGADQAVALLPTHLLQRTRSNEGSAQAWTEVVRRLEAGLPVTVAVLGGSMSLAQKRGWSENVVEWMKTRWPQADITLHNGAIGATGSTFFALCAESRLPRKRVDVVFLEHALNDGESVPATSWDSMRHRATIYEVLVRGLLRRTPSPAIFFLNWDRIGWCANIEANPKNYLGRFINPTIRGVPWLATPQAAVDMVARWYGLASLSPRNAIWHRDCDDVAFRGSFCDSGGVVGCGHLRPLGHAMVARVITSYLDELTTAARQQQGSSLEKTPPRKRVTEPLPLPIFEAVAQTDMPSATAQCTRGDEMKDLSRRVVAGDWTFVRRDPRQPAGADKPGLLSLTAPSALEIDIGPPPSRTVTLGFLRSYDERMGVLHVRCIRECSCTPVRVEGWHSRRSSVLAFAMVSNVTASQTNGCTLLLTHTSRRMGKMMLSGREVSSRNNSATSKFKILALVLPRITIDAGEQNMVGRSF